MSHPGIGVELRIPANGFAEIEDMRFVVLSLGLNGNLDWHIALAAHLDLASPAQEHLPFLAIELRAAVGIARIVRGPQPLFVNEQSLVPRLAVARVFESDLLGIGELLIVVEEKFAADRRDFVR